MGRQAHSPCMHVLADETSTNFLRALQGYGLETWAAWIAWMTWA